MTLDPDTRPRARTRSDTRMRDLGDELLAYDRDKKQVHVLNSTAREIHGLCDGRRTLADIAATLVETYGIDETTAMRDLTLTIERLASLELIEF